MSEPRAVYDATPQIITGDALDLIPTLADGSVQLVLASPPYPGQMGDGRSVWAWLVWLDAILGRIMPVLAPNAVIALNVAFKRTPSGWHDTTLWQEVPRVFEAYRLNCLDTYIWHKTNAAQNGPLAYADAPGYEPIFIYTNAAQPGDVTFNPQYKPYAAKSISANGAARIGNGRTKEPNGNGARQTTVISLPTVASDGNRPRAKGVSFPLALAARLILQYTNPGDFVLDFCAGVGTTVKAAQMYNRRAVGFEIDPEEAERARAWLREPAQMELELA